MSSSTNAASSIANSLVVDQTRIQDSDGFVATVRYVGPVASAKNSKEIYAGVEWDDETRGKHDGSVICRRTNEIVRHFNIKNTTSSSSSHAGSFLRLNKIDTGVDLDLKLIQSRYVDHDAPLVAPNNLLPYSARTSSGREKPIEFLGEMNVRKRQQVGDLNDISLRGMGISRIVSSEASRKEMVDTFGHTKEVDLAGNLFSDWKVLFDIVEIFPSLEWMSFASNKIHDLPTTMTFKEGQWSNLKVLNVKNADIRSFQTILKLEKLCPNLEELCVAYNDLSDMNAVQAIDDHEPSAALGGWFQQLKLLDLSSCNISSWKDQVRRFRNLPKLETLVLDDNYITSIVVSKLEAETEFVSVKNIQIAGSSINQWDGIESLANLSNLKSLRFRKSPLTDTIGTGEARSGTIARVPQIEYLNASQISEKERLEAERRYVSTASRELLKITSKMSLENKESGARKNDIGGDGCAVASSSSVLSETEIVVSEEQDLFHKKYPRFEELMAKHKDTMMAATQSSSSFNSTISNNAINVTIRSMAVESCTHEPLQKRLPSSMKVERLKIMCSRAFGLDIELQILHFREEGDAFPTELDDDDNTIGYYGVSDGAEILMNEIDVEAIKREDKNKVEMHKQRIKEQEEASNTLQAMQKNDIRAHLTAAENSSNRLN